MKRPDFSNVRDPENRSKKNCCCGGHSSKARKPRSKDKHVDREKVRVLWCPPKCEVCMAPIMDWREGGVKKIVHFPGTGFESSIEVCKECFERDRANKVAKALMEE